MGKKSGGGTQEVIQKNDPNPIVQPHLSQLYASTGDWFKKGPAGIYQGQRVATTPWDMISGMDMTRTIAQDGNPYGGQAINTTSGILDGSTFANNAVWNGQFARENQYANGWGVGNDREANGTFGAGNRYANGDYIDLNRYANGSMVGQNREANGSFARSNIYANGDFTRNNAYINGDFLRSDREANGTFARSNAYANGDFTRNNAYINGDFLRNDREANGLFAATNRFTNGEFLDRNQDRKPMATSCVAKSIPICNRWWMRRRAA